MKIKSYLMIALCTLLTFSLAQSSDKCYLSRSNSAKTFPSLRRCYKSNTDSCCVSGHDNLIDSEMTIILSPSCDRCFDYLEFYFCFGCHYTQHSATNETAKTTLCDSYVKRFWGDKSKPTTNYDNCGFSFGGNVYN